LSIIVAIDGPAAAGKGTVSKLVAQEYNLPHLDTGALYRASASRAHDLKIDPVEAARSLQAEDLNRDDLRHPVISQEASRISAHPDVRSALKDYQVNFSLQEGGAVLDGRDIGTAIAPQAHVKIFITASSDVRAVRRHKELLLKDQAASLAEVKEEMRVRDHRDSSRADNPLRPADDAIIIDTSELSLAEVGERVLEIIDPVILGTISGPDPIIV